MTFHVAVASNGRWAKGVERRRIAAARVAASTSDMATDKQSSNQQPAAELARLERAFEAKGFVKRGECEARPGMVALDGAPGRGNKIKYGIM